MLNSSATIAGTALPVAGATTAVSVAIVDSSGNQISSFGGGTQYTSGDTDATPIGTVAMWHNTGNDSINAVSDTSPLPVTVDSGNVSIGAPVTVIGSIASGDPDSDTYVVKIGTQYNATQPTFTDGDRGELQIDSRGGLKIVGDIAAGATDSGNPVKVGGVYTTTKPTLTNNQRSNLVLDSRGNTNVALFGQDTGQSIVGYADNADGVTVTSLQRALASVNRNTIFNGTSWDRQMGDVTNGTDVDVTRVIPGTTATALGKAEDAAHTTGDTGVFILGVRNDNASTTFGADGDYSPVSVDLKGRVSVRQTAPTGTLANVASSATSVTILAANSARVASTVYNDSTQVLYLKFGATASVTSFTVPLAAATYYEVPGGYTGIIDGIWASANGNARVTELT